MGDIIQALLKAVEIREIDLSECAEMYAGVKIPVRVNWPRAWKKQRWALSREHFAIRDALKEYTDENGNIIRTDENETNIDALDKRADEVRDNFNAWWSGVLLMTPAEKATLEDALPPPHWEWLTNRIIKTVHDYEADETKKAADLRGRTSEEPEPKPPTSGKDSPSQDG
jgi:hypothetical protein